MAEVLQPEVTVWAIESQQAVGETWDAVNRVITDPYAIWYTFDWENEATGYTCTTEVIEWINGSNVLKVKITREDLKATQTQIHKDAYDKMHAKKIES